MPASGKEATLHAHLVARDDSLALYGFASEEERDLFLHLTSVSGIGPKVAIAILSGGTPRELLRAIAAGDAKRFQAVPGIGKRTSERVIVELREKVAGELEEGVPALAGGPDDDPRSLARDGLMHLGYTLTEAEKLLDERRGRDARGPDRLARCATRRGKRERRHEHRAAIPSFERAGSTSRSRRADGRGAPAAPTTSSTARCARDGSPTSSTSARSPRSSRSSSRRRSAARSRSTTSCSPGRRASARRRSPTSSPPSSRRRSCRRPARRSSARPTSPPS